MEQQISERPKSSARGAALGTRSCARMDHDIEV
jgi:hypothetical protein